MSNSGYFNPNGIKGLWAFEFDDFEIFQKLQRNDMLQRCVTAITSSDFKFGVLYAESGCGKTSFLQAGLHHVLNEHPRHCAVYIKFSNEEPITTVMNALKKQAGVDNLPLNELYTAVLAYHSKSILVLIFDQFEQFFLHQPQAEQRQAFIAAFAEWYQHGSIKILISIRSDYMHSIVQLEQAVDYTPNWQEKFELKRFTPIQATEIFRVLAESNGLPLDKDFIAEICNYELARQDGTISPVDIQILFWLVVGFQGEEHKGFNRKLFLQKGGVEGLLENFVALSIQALSGKNQQDLAIKVLVALIDKEKTLRAGLLNAAEITERVANATKPEVTTMLERLADSKIRLITVIETDTDNGLTERKYEIAHEKLIKGVLNLARKSLQGYDQANLLLDKRVSEWLGNNKGSSYLLSWKEYLLINKNQAYLVWGDRQADKQTLLVASKRQFRGYAVTASVLLLVLTGGGLWWQFCPQAQIMECKYYLSEYSDIVSDESKAKAVDEWLGVLPEDRNKKPIVKNIEELQDIEKYLVKKINDAGTRAVVLAKLAETVAESDDKDNSLLYLGRLIIAAETIKDEYYKNESFKALIQAITTLRHKNKSWPYLEHIKTVTETIVDDDYKAVIFANLVQAAYTLGYEYNGLFIKAEMAAKNTKGEYTSFLVFKALAQAAATIGDEDKSLAYLEQAAAAAVNINTDIEKFRIIELLAKAATTFHNKDKGLHYLERLKMVVENSKNTWFLNRINNDLEESVESKASVFQALAQAAATLGDKDKSLAYLEQAKTAAENIRGDQYKAPTLQALAQEKAFFINKKRGLIYLEQLKTVAENIKDDQYKTPVFQALAQAAATLGDKNKGLAYLEQLKTSAENFQAFYKIKIFKTLGQAAATLGDEDKAFFYLGQARVAVEHIEGDAIKAPILSDLAEATIALGDKVKGLAYLEQLKTTAENITVSEIFRESYTIEVFTALGQAASTLGDENKGLLYLEHAKTAVEEIEDSPLNDSENLAQTAARLGDKDKILQLLDQATTSAKASNIPGEFKNIAEGYARIDHYRAACQLAKSQPDKNEALQILAAILREYGQQHYKKSETLAAPPPT